MSTTERIIEEVSKEGPLLPVEIASKTGLNSFLIKGYLEELVKEGKLKMSSKKVGSDSIFYLPNQEEMVKEKLEETKSSALKIKTYEREKVQETPELQKKREAFMQRLKEIEDREKQESVEKQEIKEKKFFPSFKNVIKKRVIKEDVSFLKKSENYLKEQGIELLDKIEEKKKSEQIRVLIPSKMGAIKHLIVIKDKKKISKSDLALIYTKSLELKLPAIIITCGSLTGNGEEYLKEVGEFLKIKYLQ